MAAPATSVAGQDEPAGSPDDTGRLLAFLRDRDVPCPMCRYNLRNLSRPECPECHQDLVLTVGIRRPLIVWFVVTIAPCIFSGISAALLTVPIVGVLYFDGSPPPWFVYAVVGFGWLSGFAGLALLRYRYAFLQLPPATQRLWACAAWFVHLTAFGLFTWTVFR